MMHQTNIHDDDEAESTQDDMEVGSRQDKERVDEVAVQSDDISDDEH